jgi:hypothetical protein
MSRGLYAELCAGELARLKREGKIESYSNLSVYAYEYAATDGQPRYGVKVWRGKAAKPYANFYFKTAEARNAWINQQVFAELQLIHHKAEQKAAQKAERAKMAERIDVGTLLHYSWGYDQTQCDFYQVVERRGEMVTIRAIGDRVVPGSGSANGMSDRRMPARDRFVDGPLGETLTKRIQPWGLSMDHGHATPCGDNDSFYCSWYA